MNLLKSLIALSLVCAVYQAQAQDDWSDEPTESSEVMDDSTTTPMMDEDMDHSDMDHSTMDNQEMEKPKVAEKKAEEATPKPAAKAASKAKPATKATKVAKAKKAKKSKKAKAKAHSKKTM